MTTSSLIPGPIRFVRTLGTATLRPDDGAAFFLVRQFVYESTGGRAPDRVVFVYPRHEKRKA